MRMSSLMTVGRDLQSLYGHGTSGGLSDAQLLERFAARRDEGAFEALVRRHGPMVLGVCRHILGNSHDAEDAFQATFLVLARKAATVPAASGCPAGSTPSRTRPPKKRGLSMPGN